MLALRTKTIICWQKIKKVLGQWAKRQWITNALVALVSFSVVYWGLMRPAVNVNQTVWNDATVLVWLILAILCGHVWVRHSKAVQSSWKMVLTTWLRNWIVQVVACLLAIIFVWVKVYRLSDSLFPDARNVTFVMAGIIIGQAVWVGSQRFKNHEVLAGMWLLYASIGFLPLPLTRNPLLFSLAFLFGAISASHQVETRSLTLIDYLLWSMIALSLSGLSLVSANQADNNWILAGLVLSALSWSIVLKDLPIDETVMMVVLSLSQSTAVLTWCNQIITDYELVHIVTWLPVIVAILTISALGLSLVLTKFRWLWSISDIKPLFKHWWPIGLVAGFSYSLAFALQLTTGDVTAWTINYILVHCNSQVVITALIIFSLILLLWCLIRSYWFSLAIIGVIGIAIILVDKMKIGSRNEPILPSDLAAVGQTNSLLRMVTSQYWIVAGVGLAILVIGAVVLTVAVKIDWQKFWKHSPVLKYVFLWSGLLILGSSYFWNNDWGSRIITAFDDQTMFYNQLGGAQHNGPVIQFLNNVHVKLAYEPSGYSKIKIEQIERKYQKEAAQINQSRHHELKNQTVVFNLSESLADPNRVLGVSLRHDPMPYIHWLQRHKGTTGGLMMSSGYGGGTANMEWMVLTGMNMGDFAPTLSVAYTQMLPEMKHVDAVPQAFNKMIAIHTYQGGFYSRITNYQKMGIKKFYYQGNLAAPIKHPQALQGSPYLDDQTAYQNALDRIKQQDGPLGLNLITMQNHMPYNKDWYSHKYPRVKPVDDGGITKDDDLWEYTTGVLNTDKAVKQFIHQIDEIHRPITIVLYGDHLPGLYVADMSTPKNNIKFHQTDYFIYSNQYARQHGAKNLADERHKVVGTNDLLAMVYAQTDSKVGWYQALLTRVWQDLPAMSANGNQTGTALHTRNLYTNEHSQQVKHLTKQQKELLHDYQLIEYDATVGHHYAQHMFSTNAK